MVSISEAEMQAQSARERLKQNQQQIQENLKKIVEERRQLTPKKRIPFTPRDIRAEKLKYRSELNRSERELKEAQKQQAEYQKELLQYEQEIEKAKQAQQATRIAQDQYNYAVRAYLGLTSGGNIKNIPKAIREQAKQVAESVERQQQRLQNIPQYYEEVIDPKTGEKIKQGVSIAPELAEEIGYEKFESKIPAYYDPNTGRQVLQSIDPKIAEDLGYQKTDILGYYPKTGEYKIESKTGFLTPRQETLKSFYEQVQDLPPTETPTTFKVGSSTSLPTLNDLISPTPYQQALRSSPYNLDVQKDSWYRRKIGQPAEMLFNRIDRGVDILTLNDMHVLEPTQKNIQRKQNQLDKINQQIQKRLKKGKDPTKSQIYMKETLEEELNTLKTGKPVKVDIRGTPVPIFPSGGLSNAIGVTTGIFYSKPISETSFSIYEKLTPFETKPGWSLTQVPRAGYVIGTAGNPALGVAYATDFVKSLIADPVGTSKSAREYPVESLILLSHGARKGIKRITDKAIEKTLKENIKQLEKMKTVSDIKIYKNKGTRVNSDRVVIEARQPSAKGSRVYRIEGDLIKQGKNMYFMPDATGMSFTIIPVSPFKLSRPRIYTEIQRFEIGAKQTGINLGNFYELQQYFMRKGIYQTPEAFTNLEVFTPTGTTGVITQSVSRALVTSRLGPLSQTRMTRSYRKQMKQNIPLDTLSKEIVLPFEDIGIKINQQTNLLVGKTGDIGIVRIIEPPKEQIGRTYGGGKKTPLSTTFQQTETVMSSPMTAVTKAVNTQSLKIVNTLTPDTSLAGIPKMVGGQGLTDAQLKQNIGFSNFVVNIDNYRTPPSGIIRSGYVQRPFTKIGINNMLIPTTTRIISRKKQLERFRNQQRDISKLNEMQRTRLLERQKILERQRDLQRQKEVQKELQKQRQLQQQKLIDPLVGRQFKKSKTSNPITTLITSKPQKRKFSKKKTTKKKKEKSILPTVSQQILGIKLKKPVKITGFEIARV
jgi:hypothetical protein